MSIVTRNPSIGASGFLTALGRIDPQGRYRAQFRQRAGNLARNMARRITRGRRQYRRQRHNQRRNIRRSGARSGQGITVQHDKAFIYKKKAMPKGKRKAWKRFSKKVQAVAEQDLGSRTVVFNTAVTYSNSTANVQGLAYFALYSANGTGDAFMQDLSKISTLENSGDPTSAAGVNIAGTSKFLFKSAVLDITMRNISDNHDDVLNNLAKLEVDVYEILSNKQWSAIGAGSASLSDLTACYTDAQADVKELADTASLGSTLELSDRGATPWDIPAAISKFGLKILKKTKYFIPSGETATYQIRDPKRRVMSKDYMESLNGGNKRGWTRHVLIVFKTVPGLTIGVSPNVRERLIVGMTRKYLYKMEGANQDRDIWINS